MTRYAKSLIVLGVVTFAVYATLIGVGRMYLFVGPDSLTPFDLRFLGYTRGEALLYLTHLPESAASIYVGPARALDTVFPLLFGLFMGWILWGLTRRLHPWSRIALLIAPGSYTMMDLCENALVSEMVQLGVHALPDHLVVLASSYTVSKFVTLFVAFGLLLVMMAVNLRTAQPRHGS